MPKSCAQPTAEHSRFEEAIECLPHVRTMPDGKGRNFWCIGKAVRREGRPRPCFLANYTMDCELGSALGSNFVQVLRRYPDQAQLLAEYVLKDIAAAGVLTGVEVTFMDAVAGLVAEGVRKSAAALRIV